MKDINSCEIHLQILPVSADDSEGYHSGRDTPLFSVVTGKPKIYNSLEVAGLMREQNKVCEKEMHVASGSRHPDYSIDILCSILEHF